MRNYNKSYKKNVKPVDPEQPIEETVVESELVVEETVEETMPERKMGVVTECFRLNIREEPKSDAEVITILDLATEVEIDEANSTEDFYKIYTASGIEGFCMKQFIAV